MGGLTCASEKGPGIVEVEGVGEMTWLCPDSAGGIDGEPGDNRPCPENCGEGNIWIPV